MLETLSEKNIYNKDKMFSFFISMKTFSEYFYNFKFQISFTSNTQADLSSVK